MLLILFKYSEFYNFYQDRSKCFKYTNINSLINKNIDFFKNVSREWSQSDNWDVVGTINDSSEFDEFINTFISKISTNKSIDYQLKRYYRTFIESGTPKPKKTPKKPNRRITQEEKFEALELYGNTRVMDICKKLGLTAGQIRRTVNMAHHRIRDILWDDETSDDIKAMMKYIKTNCIPSMPFSSGVRHLRKTRSLMDLKEFLINMKII